MDRRRFLAATAGLAAPLVAGCAGGGEANGSSRVVHTSDVAMIRTQFDPRNVQVDVGTAVTWRNQDATAHTVTAASDNWSVDQEVAGGDSTSFTFEASGVYDVYCRFHGAPDLSGMSMKVGVGDATIESPLSSGVAQAETAPMQLPAWPVR